MTNAEDSSARTDATPTPRRIEDCLQPKQGLGAAAAYKSIKRVAIAAAGLGPSRVSHAGILYKVKHDVHLFEMRSHEELADGVAPPGFVWVEPEIPKERMDLVIQRVRRILKCHKEKKVPYGFGYRRSAFDENGGFRVGDGEIGLTCATIVAAVFQAESLPLIDPLTWPPPDSTDLTARRLFLTSLRKTKPDHAATLERDIGAPRISPEEIVSAGASYPTVGTFENLQEGAAHVRSRLGTK